MKREFLKFGIIFFVTVAVVLWGLNFIFLNKNAPKSKATADYINFSFNPPSVTPDAGTDFTVSVLATPSINTVLRGYKTKISFDKAILQLKSIQYKVGVVSVGLGNTDADLATINNNGYVNVVAEDTNSTGYTLTSANGAELVILTFKAITKTPSNVIIDGSEFYSIASDAALSNNWVYSSVIFGVNGGINPSATPICESFSDDFSGVPSTNSFSDDFSGTAINSENFGLWTDGSGTAAFANGKVTIQLPASTDGVSKMADLDAWARKSNGDFSAEVTSNSISDGTGGTAFLAIWATIPGDANSGFSIGRNQSGGIGTYAHIYQQSNPNESIVVPLTTPIGNNDPIKYKLERIGSTINFYYDLMKGQGYQLARTVNNFPMLEIKAFFGVQSWGPDFPAITGTFDDYKQTVGPQLDSSKWEVWSNNYGSASLMTGGVASMFNPATASATIGTATVLRSKQNQISGDFSAEESLLTLNPATGKNWGSLEFSFTSTDVQNAFRLARYSDRPGKITSFQIVNGSINTATVEDKDLGLTSNTHVRIKLERIGNIGNIYYLMDGDSSYKLLRTFSNVFTGPGYFETLSVNGVPDYPDVTSTFDDFNLTCPAVPTGVPSCTPLPAFCLQLYPTICPTVAPIGGWCPPDGGNTGGNTSLNLKLKFQGIIAQPAVNSMTTRVKIGGCGLTAPTDYQLGTFTSDANGVWSGTISGFDLPACTSGFYTAYVKGQFHIQKKICDLVPTETSGGTYRCSEGKITLNPGANSLDFSGILQLVGDLPPQNGTVDAYDISLVRNCLGKTDETCLNNADVNRDGKVDTQDYSLIIASLSVKSDEE